MDDARRDPRAASRSRSFARPSAHDSAVKHMTGAALYVDDIREPAGTLHAAPGYAPIAAGRVTRLDLDAVRKAPGVVEVLTAADIPGVNDISPKQIGDDPAITPDKMMFYGQVLFVVLAETRDQARRATRLARIATAPGMPLIDVDDALVAESRVLPTTASIGASRPRRSRASPRQVTGEFRMGGQEHFYLEGQAALAVPGEDGDMMVHSSTQHPTEVQHVVAHVLGLHSNQVTVECRRMGGGFGGKESQATQWAVLAALGAHKTGRPVKLRLDRDDDMVMTGKRHDFRVDYQAGFGKDGVLRAVDVTMSGRCGYSEDLSLGVVDRTAFHADGAYFYPACRIITRRMRTNTVSNTAFRGFGGPQGKLFAERMMDHIAYTIGRDPLDVRKANIYGGTGRDRTPYGMRVEDNILPEIISDLERTSDYWGRRREITQFNAASPVLKKGIALTPSQVRHLVHADPSQPGRRAGACLPRRLDQPEPRRHRDGAGAVHQGGAGRRRGVRRRPRHGQDHRDLDGQGAEHRRRPPPPPAPTSTPRPHSPRAVRSRTGCTASSRRNTALARDQVQFREGKVLIGNQAITFGELADAGLCRAHLAVLDGVLPDAEDPLGPGQGQRPAVLLFRLRRRVLRGDDRHHDRRDEGRPRRHPPRCRQVPQPGDRPSARSRAASSRAWAG